MVNVFQQFKKVFRFNPKIDKRAVESHAQIMQNTASVAIAGYNAEVLVLKLFPL
jgi:hypothetical protein